MGSSGALVPLEAGQGRGAAAGSAGGRVRAGDGRRLAGAGGATAAPTGGCRLRTAPAHLEQWKRKGRFAGWSAMYSASARWKTNNHLARWLFSLAARTAPHGVIAPLVTPSFLCLLLEGLVPRENQPHFPGVFSQCVTLLSEVRHQPGCDHSLERDISLWCRLRAGFR